MASLFFFILSSFFFFFIFASSKIINLPPPSIIIPLTKHFPTGQYLTRINLSGSTQPTKLTLDLTGSVLWLDCSNSRSNPVHFRSIQCSSASGQRSSAKDSSCSLLLHNPILGTSTTSGKLVEHAVGFESSISTVDKFLFSCAPLDLIPGLASGVKGVLGLGKSRIGAPTQISHAFGYQQKFYLCLSSLNGMVFSGLINPNLGETEIPKSLIYTPLLEGDEYSIRLKGIKIQNKKLSLNLKNEGSPIVRISTVSSYSKLETQIYNVFVKGFEMAAESLNMSRAESIAPFELCYFGDPATDIVPIVELVLQSEMVKWRIHGHNSMVKMENNNNNNNCNVMCLGFINGGLNLGASIVLGGYQLEDNLLEFDLGSSMLGFSSSLIEKGTSCPELSSLAAQKDVQQVQIL